MKTTLLLSLLVIAACGRESANPYDGAQVFPETATQICTNQVLHDLSVTQFAGVVDCSSGQVRFSADRYTALAPLSVGSHPSSATGLRCSFTVDSGCNLTNVTVP